MPVNNNAFNTHLHHHKCIISPYLSFNLKEKYAWVYLIAHVKDQQISDTYHITFMHLGAHSHLDDEPGGVPQDEGGDEIPVDDVSQASDAPARKTKEDELMLRYLCHFSNTSPVGRQGK